MGTKQEKSKDYNKFQKIDESSRIELDRAKDYNKFQRVDESERVILCAKCCTVGDVLYIIAKKGRVRDNVELMYTEKYEGVAMEVVSYMTESFGWEMIDKTRQTKETKMGYEIKVWVIELEKIGALK